MSRVYKYIFAGLVCLFIGPAMANAECSDDYINQLKEVANRAKVSKEFQFSETNYSYNWIITVENKPDTVAIKDDYGRTFSGDSNAFAYPTNHVTVLKFYPTNKECSDVLLKTTYVDLPYFNTYSRSDECKGAEEFEYCKEFTNTAKVTLDEFQTEIKEWKEKNGIKDSPKNEIPLVAIVGAAALLLIIIVVVAIILIKRRKKKTTF